MGISVFVCCYNSAARLPETLSYLSQQVVARDLLWEVVVVNNNSTDDTVAVAKHTWESLALRVPLHIIDEPTPGLSFAREAGIAQAKFDLVLFCDDDNWLEAHYLQTAFDLMERYPQIGCVGGYSEEVSDVALPWWFAHFRKAYACGAQYDKDGWLETRNLVWGAGMVARKSLFEQMQAVQFKSFLNDRKGSSLSSGGDSEICIVALMLGYRIYYTSQLRLKHFMSAGRLQWSYLVRLYRGHARSWYIKSLYFDVLQNRPLKNSWMHEGAIRIYYFLKREPFRQAIRYFNIQRNIGDAASVQSLVEIERLWAHLSHLPYRKTLRQMRSLYRALQQVRKPQHLPLQNPI